MSYGVFRRAPRLSYPTPRHRWIPTAGAAPNVVRASFDTPLGTPYTGIAAQEFVAEVRKKGAGSDPLARIELWESGVFKATVVADTPVSSTTLATLRGTWDAATLTDASGAGVELRVVGTPQGAGSQLEVGAVEWNLGAPVVHAGTVRIASQPALPAGAGAAVAAPARISNRPRASAAAVNTAVGAGRLSSRAQATGAGQLALAAPVRVLSRPSLQSGIRIAFAQRALLASSPQAFALPARIAPLSSAMRTGTLVVAPASVARPLSALMRSLPLVPAASTYQSGTTPGAALLVSYPRLSALPTLTRAVVARLSSRASASGLFVRQVSLPARIATRSDVHGTPPIPIELSVLIRSGSQLVSVAALDNALESWIGADSLVLAVPTQTTVQYERLSPDQILQMVNLEGELSDIQGDPTEPDQSFLIYVG